AGNITAQGASFDSLTTHDATVSGSLFASLIEAEDGLTVNLGTTSNATDSADLASSFKIKNAGDTVASIDASGSATLATLTTSKINIPSEDATNPEELNETELNQIAKSIGMGKIKAGFINVIIKAPAVTKDSLIFITPTSNTPLPLAVTDKIPRETFTVSIPQATTNAITFNWWIIN
ncbi:hypothetical protein GYA49_05865, partial [Candidatus Beckwithbacteria bacterium]|nr:hypothetical protein [Candidatus Beckwithbacteria bacterium]